jgi:hypothetical protein
MGDVLVGNINLSRVILGGLVAGLVGAILSFIFRAIFSEQMVDTLTRLGLSEPTGGTQAIMIALGFVAGIMAIWFYAAVRPRFGAGVKTAVIVAVALWVLVSFIPAMNFMLIGLIEGSLVWLGMLFDLIGII